jgi:hypothetical protein
MRSEKRENERNKRENQPPVAGILSMHGSSESTNFNRIKLNLQLLSTLCFNELNVIQCENN